MKETFNDVIKRDSVFAWIALATGLLLSIPLIAMQFTNEVDWDSTDFIVMGCLLFFTSGMFVMASRKVSRKYRPAIGAIFVAAFFYVWAELAVGIFTNLGS